MRRWISLSLVVMVVSAFSTGYTKECRKCIFNQRQLEREIDEVEFDLDRLEKARLLHRSQGLWYLDLGTRLQFERGRFRESQQAFEEAKLQFQAVEMIERKMRHLERRRQELLRGR